MDNEITQDMWNQARMRASLVRNRLWHDGEFDRMFKVAILIDRYTLGERSEELYNAMTTVSW